MRPEHPRVQRHPGWRPGRGLRGRRGGANAGISGEGQICGRFATTAQRPHRRPDPAGACRARAPRGARPPGEVRDAHRRGALARPIPREGILHRARLARAGRRGARGPHARLRIPAFEPRASPDHPHCPRARLRVRRIRGARRAPFEIDRRGGGAEAVRPAPQAPHGGLRRAMAVLASPDGVLLLDKPAGITSTRALAVAKRALGAAKAGHTGTLDPFATGLLPLAFGEATKFSRFLIDAPKAYEATLVLGEETESGDPETPVVRRSAERPAEARIAEVLRAFEGPQDQTPPMHSALHVGGRRLYEYARLGMEVPRAPRRIEIFALTRLRSDPRSLTLAVRCSKGTYVRVLAADIGRALGCGAYLES